MDEIYMGSQRKTITDNKDILFITICVTEDCNLACKYCYYIHKNSKKRLDIYTGKQIIDFILSDPTLQKKEFLVLDFIGGEPTLEINLISQICDYLVLQMYLKKHKWLTNYDFTFTSNGVLYDSQDVQKFIKRHYGHISFNISIDGNKAKHDASRIKKDGKGSFDNVISIIPLWKKQFPDASNKSTFSSMDLKYLKDSIIFLWNIGIKNVVANVVFEDVWQENDDILYEMQLKELADYVIENRLWNSVSVSFFDPANGLPVDYGSLNINACGAGNSFAIDCEGKIFPCHRFFGFSQSDSSELCIGDIENGINYEKLRPFYALNYRNQSSDECNKCEVGNRCFWCTGHNYSVSDIHSIFDRQTFICKMHRAEARANKYFWNKYSEITQKISPRTLCQLEHPGPNTKYLYILTSDNFPSYCHYNSRNKTHLSMDEVMLESALKYAEENNYIPVVLGDVKIDCTNFAIRTKHLSNSKYEILIADENTTEIVNSTLIYKVNRNNLEYLSVNIQSLLSKCLRINIIVEDMFDWTDKEINMYQSELATVGDIIYNLRSKGNSSNSINVLDDIMNLREMMGCNAGVNKITVAPNGKFYICAAFYYENPDDSIGNLEDGLNNKFERILKLDKSPLCNCCDNYHCDRCVFLNKKITGAYNIPSSIQCKVTNIERGVAMKLQHLLIESSGYSYKNSLLNPTFNDPIEMFRI